MQCTELPLPGLALLEPRTFGDARGSFFEVWNERTLAGVGISARFVQENQSRSARGVLRGLHYQKPQAQGKLVRVIAGRLFDVVVDLRRGAGHFGRWHGLTLSAESRQSLWVPAGFAHGFLVLSEFADVVYAVTDYYAPQSEHTLAWNDPGLGIAWPLADAGVAAPLVSPKDARGLALATAPAFD